MKQVLLVKMSSMGDLVHSFPALTDAARQGYRFDWVVEEGFVDLATRHPAVDRIYPIALRRWRKRPLASMGQFRKFRRDLQGQHYAKVLDAQGLVKSAVVARLAQTDSIVGLATNSAREGLASRFYNERHEISWQQHAIDRLRLLFAAALSYEVDLSKIDATQLAPVEETHAIQGSSADPARSSVVLLQGTSWPSKEYPPQGWRELVVELAARGESDILMLSGNTTEHARAKQIARSLENSSTQTASGPLLQTPMPESLSTVIDRISNASLVIGVDSGLTHLAATLGVPTLGLYGATAVQRTGARGPKARNMVSSFGCAPCLQRQCSYRGAAQSIKGEAVQPACFAQWSATDLLDAVADVWRVGS